MTRTHHGRIAVISGAASGIGQASAVRLAEEGARIVVADRENAKPYAHNVKISPTF